MTALQQVQAARVFECAVFRPIFQHSVHRVRAPGARGEPGSTRMITAQNVLIIGWMYESALKPFASASKPLHWQYWSACGLVTQAYGFLDA